MNNNHCDNFNHSRDNVELQSTPDHQERTWQSDCDSHDDSPFTPPPAVRQCGFHSSATRQDGTSHSDSDPHDSSSCTSPPSSETANAATPRSFPLQICSWYSAEDVKQLMCDKDESFFGIRDPDMLAHHPDVVPHKRAMLFEWMNELCAQFKFHRETYFLAVDYFDRYLSKPKLVLDAPLLLIGGTCIFIAAKVEETYQPLVDRIALHTDGVCQAADILIYEQVILTALDWSVNPITPMGWLGIFMQMSVNNSTRSSFGMVDDSISSSSSGSSSSSSSMETNTPCLQLSSFEFVQTAQLLDLCSMDMGMLNYKYFVIAAAAVSHTVNREAAMRCFGLDWSAIQACASWMEPFFEVINELDNTLENRSIDIQQSDIIQTRFITMRMFGRVVSKMNQKALPETGLTCEIC